MLLLHNNGKWWVRMCSMLELAFGGFPASPFDSNVV